MFSLSSSARHYNSDLSIWLSVAPMVDVYLNVSPYCADNTVRIFDMAGREIWIDEYRYVPSAICPEEALESTRNKWNTLNDTYLRGKTGYQTFTNFIQFIYKNELSYF